MEVSNQDYLGLVLDYDKEKGIATITQRNYFKKGETIMKITKDMLIGDILDADRETAQFFFEMGMHCLGCPSARGESLEMACAVHGVDVDEMVEEINTFLDSKK